MKKRIVKKTALELPEDLTLSLANIDLYVNGYEEIGTILGAEIPRTYDTIDVIELQFGHGKIYVSDDNKRDLIRAGYFREASFYQDRPSTWPCIKIEATRRWLRTRKNEVLFGQPE